MLNRLLKTDNDVAATVARVVLGLVMFPHAAQKVLGWFGGYGIQGTLGFFSSIGIPTWLGVLVLVAEFGGAIALIVGGAGRLAAAGIVAVMAGAVLTSHLANGFFMNWAGSQAGEGFEFHILAAALASVVMIKGSGAFSLDGWLSRARVEIHEPAAEELAGV